MPLEALGDRRHYQVEVPSDDSDNEQVDGDYTRAYSAGSQVDNDGRGDAHPHLTKKVGRDERDEAPRVGQE